MMNYKKLILIILGVCIMGTGNLPDLAAAPTKVDATTTQYNSITDALQGHQVMRDSDGVAEDNTSDIGRPSSGRPRKLYVGTGLNVAGQDIDLDSIALQTTGISSGKSKTSGYPNFLTPEGVTGGATNTFTIEADTTDLVITIDGAGYTLETDLTSDDLSLAPSSNNTCTVNDSVISGNPEWAKTIGEYGYVINIDDTGGIGSEITDLDGTVQVFQLDNTDTGIGSEYLIATINISRNQLIPIRRGVGGTDKIAFSDSDTITLLKGHYIFLDNNLTTIDTTTTYPTWSATEPGTPATGDYWWDASNKTWKRYSGASWEQLGRIYLGYAICDSADCVAVEHEDFNLAWNSSYSIERIISNYSDSKIIDIIAPINVNVAGEHIRIDGDMSVNIDDNVEPGELISSGNWNYIYLSQDGEIFTSPKIPRRTGSKLGYYHPNEYWRRIGFFLVSGAGGTQSMDHRPEAGTIQFSKSTVDVSTLISNSALTVIPLEISPMVSNAVLTFRTGTAGESGYRLDIRSLGRLTTTYNYLNLVSDNYYWALELGNIVNTLIRVMANSGTGLQTEIGAYLVKMKF